MLDHPEEMINCLETVSAVQAQAALQPDQNSVFGGTIEMEANAPFPEDHNITLVDLVARGDPADVYQESKKIGEGAAGEIFLGFHKMTKRTVALKKMTLTQQNTRLLTTEIAIMKSSRHANIVEYIDSYMVKDRLWVVMEVLRIV